MADLLSDNDKNSFKSSILDLFDTFSRDIKIHKAPKKIINETATQKVELNNIVFIFIFF